MSKFRNIVFDLGGVVFARDPQKFSPEFREFFSFVYEPQMPHFWEEYDRGTLTLNEVQEILCERNHCERELCERYIAEAIDMQEEIRPTKSLIEQLKEAGYELYVLSNMSREFIDFLRLKPVYQHFVGEVVSCEELVVKPEPEIYRLLIDRYSLDPAQTLFIDDREANINAAEREGICGFHFDRHDPQMSCDLLARMLL